jgi:imidazole glycerol-phosphate synthase subunit HisH
MERSAMSVAIVDYGSGNLHSAKKAFEKAAYNAGLSLSIELTSDPHLILKADRVILPGVGAFADCKKGLEQIDGMIDALEERVLRHGVPFFGICVGMQLLASRGLEHNETKGLDWIKGDVVAIKPQNLNLKIPHMGWNTINPRMGHPLFHNIATGDHGLHAYFVHSYCIQPENEGDIAAITDYGGPIISIVARDNIFGTQFHPEKSQKLGLQLLANFLGWKP